MIKMMEGGEGGLTVFVLYLVGRMGKWVLHGSFVMYLAMVGGDAWAFQGRFSMGFWEEIYGFLCGVVVSLENSPSGWLWRRHGDVKEGCSRFENVCCVLFAYLSMRADAWVSLPCGIRMEMKKIDFLLLIISLLLQSYAMKNYR